MGEFAGIRIVELRVYADPSDPENSIYHVLLPNTTLDEIVNKITGQTLSELLEIDSEGKSILIESISEHMGSSIVSEDGVHALRYWEGSWQVWDKTQNAWKSAGFASATVDGETLVLT